MPKIVAAAIKFKSVIYALAPPARHHDIVRFIIAETNATRIKGEQGFLDSQGHFLNRHDAMEVARAAGQLLPTERIHSQLFSENLW